MIIWEIICILSAIVIGIDLVMYPQKMRIMNSVWVINALWGGIIVLFMYFIYGRQGKKRNRYESLSLNTLHCGAGCTLADIIGMILGFFISMNMGIQFIISYFLALIIGVFFQYSALHEMDHASCFRELIRKSISSDFLSLTAWQLGMLLGQWIMMMLISQSSIVAQIFVMQIAMMVGFLFSYPMNAYLVKKHIKMLMH